MVKTSDPDQLRDRKHPVHLPVMEQHNRAVIVFVTICTSDRKKVLCDPEAHASLKRAWFQADSWSVGRYVIMPDHVHLFCSPAKYEHSSLPKWMKYWKSISAQNWNDISIGKVWQREYWDRQLRCSDSYNEKWEYVRNNPVRAGLVENIDDWEYQGEMNVLFWHD